MSAPRRGIAVLTCLAAFATPLGAQDSSAASFRTARVTYLTGASAYIDAGRENGLREGAPVQVIRGGAVIGVLKVAFLASRQASCDIVKESVSIAVGDSVRFTPVAPPPDSKVTAYTALPASPRLPVMRNALRGRVGAQYLTIGQGGGEGFTQPSLDLRLEGRPFGNGSIGLAVDVRARRTTSTFAGASAIDGHARAYQLALFWNPPGSRRRVTLGRQIAPGSAAVGLLDGVLAELIGPQWSAGLFGGSQPEPVTLGFSADILQLGGYVRRRSRPGGSQQWSTTLGVSGSYQAAHANREFAFLQGTFTSPRFNTFVSQEVDYYRPWKRTPGTGAISPTSTFVTARYRASERLDVHAGFDNRRNVLLYRDFVNPLTTFDDAFRQGAWVGLDVRLTRRYSVGFDARESASGAAGRADSYTLAARADRVTPLAMGVRARTTYFRSQSLDGWLHSLALSFDPSTRLHLELSGGARLEHDALAVPSRYSIRWTGLDLDMNLASSWYLMLSANGERGGAAPTSEIFGGLSVRF